MKIKKEAAIGIIIVFVFLTGITGIMIHRKNRNREDLAVRVAALSGGPPSTVEGLRSAIAAYEKQIEQHVKDAAQLGVYWKILAVRLQDQGLHNEALTALERAIYFTPEDRALHYMTGVSAGFAAKNIHSFPGVDSSERDRYFALAEEGYLRAIEIDDRYLRPRYGIAVLYVFELDRPAEAIPHLLKCLELSGNDTDAMFVLGRAYYMTGAFKEAVEVYDRIIGTTKDGQKQTEARNNRQLVMERLYG
ncbi:MAG: tetratricopeptide repeat protein [Treponema sp.]|jgi:tetratricopeptide (TPR) repeat protein|nr:tetratricopeptide repeat protein [Treponema sp.]